MRQIPLRLMTMMMMMRMMMVMINCFCGVTDRWNGFSLIYCRDHCQGFSSSQISNTPRVGFESAQNLNLGFLEWSCAVVITTKPRCHIITTTLRSNLKLRNVRCLRNQIKKSLEPEVQRCIQNPVKYLRWSFLQKFCKRSSY